MSNVVVAEDEALRAGPPNAFNHRIVIERVGKDRAAWHQPTKRAEGREIRNPA